MENKVLDKEEVEALTSLQQEQNDLHSLPRMEAHYKKRMP